MRPRRLIPFLFALFALPSPASAQSIDLLSPDTSGIVWSGANDVSWLASTSGWVPGDTVRLEWTTGTSYSQFAQNLPYDLRNFRWHTSTIPNGSYKVRISKSDAPLIRDESVDFFQLSNPVIGKAYFVNDTDLTNDVYCTAVGDDFNSGTSPGAPKWNLQSIIDGYVLGAGDVVFVDTGRWSLPDRVYVTTTDRGGASASLCFAGSPNATVFSGTNLPPSRSCLDLNGSRYLGLAYFTAQSSPVHGIRILSCPDIALYAATATGNTESGIYLDSSSRVRLENCSARKNLTGISIVSSASKNILISRCSLFQNEGGISITQAENIGLYRSIISSDSYNLALYTPKYMAVCENVLAEGRGIFIHTGTSSLRIFNNIIQPNGSGRYAFNYYDFDSDKMNLISDFNLINPIGGAITGYWKREEIYPDLRTFVLGSGQDGHSITGDPLFFDPAGDDFHLQSTEGRYSEGSWHEDSEDSPALNAGAVSLASATLAGTVQPRASILPLSSSSGFSAIRDWVEVEGDFASYTGIAGNTLIGCADSAFSHSTGATVVQPTGADFSLEPDPNGARANIDAYANTPEASKSSRRSLFIGSPVGKPLGTEKWSERHSISWRTFGDGWTGADTLSISYSTDSVNWAALTAAVPFDSSPYSWNTASSADSGTGRIRIEHSAGTSPRAAETRSGIMVADNTPPANVGCSSPAEGVLGLPRLTTLVAREINDSPAGLNPIPYYFRADTDPGFASPNLLTSGWIVNNLWTVNLNSNSTYYWQVRGRDDADPSNVSEFQSETNIPGSYRTFRTQGIYRAETVEASEAEAVTNGLRWILQHYNLDQGDIVYVTPGTYVISQRLELPADDEGTADSPVRIVGWNGEVLLDGGGTALNCLRVTGDWFQVENFSFTGATGSGVRIDGGHVTLQGGRSFRNGGDGIEVRGDLPNTGDYASLRNMLVYENSRAGIHLLSSFSSILENNTCSGNGTRGIYLEDTGLNGSSSTVLRNNIAWARGTGGQIAVFVETESQTGFDSDYNDFFASSPAQVGYWNSSTQATFSSWTAASGGDLNSISANPLFVGGSNYRLQSTAGSYKPGIGWTGDGADSPGLDRGEPRLPFGLETAPSGGRINLGAYGNTREASRSPGKSGRNFFVNDASTEYDYFCSTSGLPWPLHNGLSSASPLDSIQAVLANYALTGGDSIFIDTGLYGLNSPVSVTISGSDGNPVTLTGSPEGAVLDAGGTVTICLRVSSASYVSLNGLQFINASQVGLNAFRSDYLMVAGCRVTTSGGNGIYITESKRTLIRGTQIFFNKGAGIYCNECSDFPELTNNVARDNQSHGIYFYRGSNAQIGGNSVSSNLGQGIYLFETSGSNLIQGNSCFSNNGNGINCHWSSSAILDNELRGNGNSGIRLVNNSNRIISGNTCSGVTGIYLDSSNNCQLANNLILETTGTGIYLNGCQNPALRNNVFYQITSRAVYIADSTYTARFSNNIFWVEGLGNTGLSFQYSNPAAHGHTLDYNLYHILSGATLGYWTTWRNTLSAWQAASRQDGHSASTDPLFGDPAGGDFHLRSTEGKYLEGKWVVDAVNSPGLNKGDPASDYSQELSPNGGRINLGAYGNTPEASRSGMKTLSLSSPLGSPWGTEKWSRNHEIMWAFHGAGWMPTDTIRLEYTTNGVSFFEITAGRPYISGIYSSWNTLSASGDNTNYRVKISSPGGPSFFTEDISGFFIVDNTPPTNVGCRLPADGSLREPISTTLTALSAGDSPAGLNATAYYFQIDTTPLFNSPARQNSDWRALPTWHAALQPNTTYYWRVNARDDAVPVNERGFCGDADAVGTYWHFRTLGVYHALDIESETVGLRWILDNVELNPGDIVYVDAGVYPLSSPLEFSPDDEGSADAPVRIVGYGGEVLLDGGGIQNNCLVLSGDYFQIENFSFTDALSSGVLITGDHNTLTGGASYLNGGDGIQATGSYVTVKNMRVYDNALAGIHLYTSQHSLIESNTCARNGTREVFLEDQVPAAPYHRVGSADCSILNNILWASGAGRIALWVDSESQVEFSSDYNDLYSSSGGAIGYWNSATRASFADWNGASFQDQSSINLAPLFAPDPDDFHLLSTGGRWDAGSWTNDTQTSPGVNQGSPFSIYALESAPNGGRINLGAYGNTVQASRAPSLSGRNFYVNDADTEWDYYCSTGGLPWPDHDGMSPASPLDSLRAVFSNHTMLPGDTVYLDTGLYSVTSTISLPASGETGRPIAIAGSPNISILDIEGVLSTCLSISGKSYINLDRIWIFNASGNAVSITSSPNCSVANSVIRGSGSNAIYGNSSYLLLGKNVLSYNYGSGAYLLGGTESRLEGNTSDHNSGDGFYLSNATSAAFRGNTAFANLGRGAYLYNLPGSNLVNENRFQSNQGRGLYASLVSAGLFQDNTASGNTIGMSITECHDCVITGNTVFSNTGSGLYIVGSSRPTAAHNTIYGNAGYGITLSNTCPDSRIINNTCYQNAGELNLTTTSRGNLVVNNILWAAQTGRYAIYVDTVASQPYSNYNILYATGGADIGYWSGRRISFDQWKAASGQDGASLNYNPVFVDPDNGDFHLQSPLGSYHGGLWTPDANASPGLNLGQIYTADSYLTQPISSSSTFLELTDASNFLDQTDTTDIQGDFIAYTGKSGNYLVGASGVNGNYPAGTRIFQPAGGDYTREPEPNGGRINIGAYGGTNQASLASKKTLAMVEPLGGEKWNGVHNIRWLAVGEDWVPGDTLVVEYTTNGSAFITIATETYPTQIYPNWNTLSAAGDGNTYQISVREPGGLRAGSGTFTIDNTPPASVGCFRPEDGDEGLPSYVPLRALTAADALVGLHPLPYYFQVATSAAFTPPGLINSGWVLWSMWTPNLSPGSTYYWRVKARDEIFNESLFCGFSADTDGYGVFTTSAVHQALNIESATTGLRWILANRDLEPGDTIYVSPGTYVLASPLTISAPDSGSSYYPVRIAGTGAGVVLDGNNLIANCLILDGNFIEIDNISFTRATGAGLHVSGDNNTVRRGRSNGNGDDGVLITGNANTLLNFVLDSNAGTGVALNGGEGNRVVNATSYNNSLGEVFCLNSPHSYLRNSILWAAATSAYGIFVDAASQNGFVSDYNDLIGQSPAILGYWGGDRADLAAWKAASLQDAASMSLDPLFAPAAGDYHLQSPAGRWVSWASWTDSDSDPSPCIDAGDPAFSCAFESSPKGGRINLGAYGNTYQSSRSPGGAPGTNYWVNDTSLAGDVYTSATGNDTYSGALPNRPKQTLKNLVDFVDINPGDTVYIDTGNYPLAATVEIGLPDSGIAGSLVCLSGSPNRSLLQGNAAINTGIYLDRAQYLEMANLTLAANLDYGIRFENANYIYLKSSAIEWNGQSGAGAASSGGAGVRGQDGSNVTIADSVFSGNITNGIQFETCSGLTISGNVIGKNFGYLRPGTSHAGVQATSCPGLSVSGNAVFRNYAGLAVSDSNSTNVDDNTIYSNERSGASFSISSAVFRNNLVYANLGSGAVFSGQPASVQNNTFYWNTSREITIDAPNCTARNNIAWAAGAGNYGLYFLNTSGHFSDFNNLYATGGAGVGWWGVARNTLPELQIVSRRDSHSLSADPLFANPAGADGILGGRNGADDDFHPQSTEGSYHFGSWTADAADSPSLNSGSPYDVYGLETAPNGDRINQGAYGNTEKASRSSHDSIFLITPYGGAFGDEKWSGEHDLAWLPVGTGWGGGDTVGLSYSIDGSAWSSIAAGIAWNDLTYPVWDTSAYPDGSTYQVRVADDSDPGVSSSSGRFIIDNTPPVNVGCSSPADGSVGHDVSLTLAAVTAADALAGLHSSPYYFRLDTSPSFSSPIVSGWLAGNSWPVSGLNNRTWYYWQVQARDAADLPNVSAFYGDTDVPGSWWTFRTAAVFIVNNPEEFRDVLDSYTLEQGDRIYVNADGDFSGLTAPIVVTNVHSGTSAMPIIVQDYNGRPVISGDGTVSSLLDIQGSYFLVQGIDFTGAGGSGLLLEGDHNTANSCSAYENGTAGFETTGFSNRIQNTFTWLNALYGILLNGAATSWVLNNSAYGNGSFGIALISSTGSLLNNNNLWAAQTGQSCLGVDAPSQPTASSDWNNLYPSGGGAVGDWSGVRSSLANWQSASGQDANSLSQNPRFYKIAWWGNREFIYDLHLISNLYGYSPDIDRGLSGGTVPLLDYDIEGRWDDPLVPNQGGGPFNYYDIGADEYVDQDLDYLPDYWEVSFFSHTGEGYQVDTDKDGLINIDEYYYYTNPANPDTDFDAFSDGEEVSYGTNPLDPDTDYDGLMDGWEVYYYTNAPYSNIYSDPLDPDTDDDGYNANFNDGSEVAYWNAHSWAHWYSDINYGGGNGLVNLLDPDSDGDGCPDGWEVFYGLDPADYGQFEISNGGVGDPDGDRLNNVEEYYFGTSPVDPASPITRYIDRTATGAGNGTSWPDAFTSLENGLDWANATDVPVILLATSGVYYERNLELERDRIALFGTHPRMPVLDGQSLGRGFIIFNVAVAKIDSFVIRNCRVSAPGAGVYLSNSSPTLSNLVLYRNVSAGTGRGGAMNLAVNSSPLIADCAIVGNTGNNDYGGIYVASGVPLIYNTILWGNGDDLQGVQWNQLFACDIEGGDGAGFNGNISIEPNFYHLYSAPLDPQKYLHLNAASPAINSGHSWRTMIWDFEGDSRWNYLSVPATGLGIPGRNYYDIGTDEFVDLDYNALPDWWEVRYFGAAGQDPDLDQEPDGLINSQEYYYLTDPLNADTDFDALTDSSEVSYWNTIHDAVWPDNPNNPHRWDSDDDGDYLVNVIDPDSDADGLLDGLEVYYYLTDPGAFDTDLDTLGGDGEEVDYWNVQHNILFPSGAHTTWNYDWDGDGIVNLLDWDSDNDGTPDGWERDYSLDPCDDGFYFLVNGAGGDGDNDRVNNWMEYRFETDPTESWSPQTVVVARSGWADYTSIGEAIAAYSPQSHPPRAILVRPGTYAEKDLVMKEGLSLLGEYAAATIIDASGGRGLIFNGVVNALVDGFTIRNASVEGPGAGILCYASSPFISNCVLAFNTATGPTGFGGAIYCSNFAYPDIVNCTIADNRGTDDRGGVYLAAPEDQVALVNTILWSNGDDLFGTQTGMVRYCDIEDGDYAGVTGNLSADPVFTNQSEGNYHIHWTSPLLCVGDYPKAGGYDLDGTSRPQTVCPGPFNPIILPPQQAFEIGVHEPLAQPSPTPSPTMTPTPSPTMTPTPSPTPSASPSAQPSRTATPSPTVTPMTPPPTRPPGPTPYEGTPTPTPMTPPPVSPPPTPVGPTSTPTPEFPTPSRTPTPYNWKTPTPTPFQIDFYYRDLANSSFLYLWTPDTYYSIGWATDTWQEISGMPDDTLYNAQWTLGTLTCWSGWFEHTRATQWLESCWATPIPVPSPSPTPFQIDFYYRDPLRHSYLILHTPHTYYSIGYSSGSWQALSGFPDYTWYNAQWSWGTRPDQTWWSDWFMHTTSTQYLQAYWTTPTPSVTPTPTITVTPTASPSPSPTPSYAYWYLAAGATQIRPGSWVSQTINFEEYVQVTNPTTHTAPVEITYVDETGPLWREDTDIPPESRHTIKVNNKPYCAANDSISMIVIDRTDRIIMVERSMYWDAGGYIWGGGNNSVGNNTTNLVWYLPEGATHVFDTFIHVLNPDEYSSSRVRVTFMNELAQTWTVEKSVGPQSNWTIHANEVVGSQAGISTTVEVLNGIPVAAERTMYWDTWEEEDPDRYIEWVEGHASLGTTEAATKWYIPEGATHIFDHFILVQNPSLTQSANVRVTFMDYHGKETVHDHTVPPHSRYTIWTNFILGSVQGFSAEVESRNGVPIFVEHATYWDAAGYHWGGGHGTIGLIHPAPLWFLPEGSTTVFDEYLLIANPNQTDTAQVKITFMGDFGVQTEVRRVIPPHTRYTLRVNDILTSSAISSKVAETEDRIPIVVERAMYWNSPPGGDGGIHWKGGHSTIGIGVRNVLPTKMIRE